jgi:hypothetical protein
MYKQRGRPRTGLLVPRLNKYATRTYCHSGLERSDIMKWTGEYIIDDSGQCVWREGLRIQDEQMKSAYRRNTLIEFIIESSAIMGVKVGIA